ncbi:MAG TPA: cytochrome c peroxidase, partial [Anaerolineae bacterium]|nr:cytochrome c peroxidase [Anaerolineae bacterium]
VDESGRATFREVGVEVGLEADNYEYGLGALLSDFDRDGDLDLLVANDTNPNRLYENIPWPGGPGADPEGIGFRLAEVGGYADIDDDNSGMGVASGDYDNDGRFDLMITNLGRQLHSIYRNQSEPDRLLFEEAMSEIGVADFGVGWTGWGISWADVDHDTDLDLIIANGGVPVLDVTNDAMDIQLLLNLTAQGMPGRFQDLTEFAGFADIEPLLSRGSAMADYDNDGDLDMAVNTIGGDLVLLRNENSAGHWLTVELAGFHPGAVVTAVLPDGRELLCESKAGSSYLSTEDPRCHFGLGAADQLADLIVRWPDGAEQRLGRVKADDFLVVEKDQDAPVEEQATQAGDKQFLFQLMLRDGGAWPMDPLPQASPEMLALGEALFWDKELSGNRDVACATCHHPLAGTGDDLSLSVGVGGSGFAADRQLGSGRELIPRNAPEIFNRGVAGWETMFWDGRVSGTVKLGFTSPAGAKLPLDLANVVAVQAMFPVTSRDEMRGRVGDQDVFDQRNELALLSDSDPTGIWDAIMDRLLAIPEYRTLFADAYPEIAHERLRFQHAANAIAAYEMSVFTHLDSPWDRYLAGEQEALAPEARRGAALFFGEAGCSQCHNGPLLTDQRFHNIGVPQLGPGKGDDEGHDYGRGRETGLTADMYAFRTPPLRNVALTGPWMHNGAYITLEDAVRHHLDPAQAFENYDSAQLDPLLEETYEYQSGVLLTLDPLLEEPITLTDREVGALMAFLHALTSPSAAAGCELVPESVPSGLPVDVDPVNPC